MATQKIETGLIADSAVTTAKLADNSVTAAKIAAGSLDDQLKGISSSADAVAITIDSSENVGIGVTPAAHSSLFTALDIDNTAITAFSDVVGIWEANTYYDGSNYKYRANGYAVQALINNSGEFQIKQAASGTAGANVTLSQTFTVDSSGNVGIGMISPSGNLHVAGASGNAGRIYLSDTDNGTGATDSLLITKSGTGASIYNRDSGNLNLGTNDDNDMVVIDGSGNVGIGTSSSSSKLNVVDTSSADAIVLKVANGYTTDAANDAAGIMFQLYRSYATSLNDAAFVKAVKEQAWDASGDRDSALTFGTRSGGTEPTEHMRLDSSGNVGIGTDSPAANLDVTSTSSDAVFLRSSNATTSNVYITNTNATTGNTANLYFAPANNVAGSQITSIAIEDFSSSANRTADLAFSTRLNGTMSERLRIDSSGSTTFDTGTNDGAKITGAENSDYIDSSIIADVNTKGTFIGIKRPEDGRVTVHGIGTYDTAGNTKNNLAITSRSDIVFAGNDGEISRFLLGGGLCFNGDTAAANALDDYEEGTWTPAFAAVTVTSLSYYTKYTKIGNVVYIHAKIDATGVFTTDSSIFTIQGLPYTAKDSGDTQQRSIIYLGGDMISMSDPSGNGTGHFRTNGNDLQGVYVNSSGNTVYWSYSNLAGNDIEFHISGYYFTDS